MNVGIDIRTLLEGQYSGVSEYTWHAVTGLLAQDKKNQYFLFYNNRKKRYRPPHLNYPYAQVKGYHYPNKLFNLSLALLDRPKIDSMIGTLDWFWLPGMQFFAQSQDTKLLLSVHDLSFLRWPEFFGLKDRIWQRTIKLKRLCDRATKINAISENTKHDLVELLNINPTKIFVTYLGVSEKYRPVKEEAILNKTRSKYKLPAEFVLFLGNLEPRKNVEGLIQGFTQATRDLPQDMHLVIAGKKGWLSDSIFKQAKKSKVRERIKFIGYVDAADKPSLYTLAQIFCYPSFYEGFGLPPLEAMACGTPVIVGNNSSLPEVVGDSGLLVDPFNQAQIAQAIIKSRQLSRQLSTRGLRQAKKFRWENTANAILKIMKQK